MPNPAERRHPRGAVFLFLAAAQLVAGLTFLRPHLRAGGFVLYWTVCLSLTVLALGLAVLELRRVRNHARREEQSLLRETFSVRSLHEPHTRN